MILKLKLFFFSKIIKNDYYLKLTEACQTKAKSKNKIGIIGKTSTSGSNGAYASGNFVKKKVIKKYLVLINIYSEIIEHVFIINFFIKKKLKLH